MSKGLFVSTLGNVVKASYDDLDAYQRAVGGWIEALDLTLDSGRQVSIYFNEDGIAEDLPANAKITALVQSVLHTSIFILGDVVIIGPPDAEGDTTDLLPATMSAIISFMDERN